MILRNKGEPRIPKVGGETQQQEASTTVRGMLANALGYHQAGNLTEAERLYRQILETEPRHADALHLLGVIARRVGRHDVAIELITRAIRINSGTPSYYYNLGNALHDSGRHSDAVTAYGAALLLQPDYTEAHSNRGNALKELGRVDHALVSYGAALRITPDYAEAHYNSANALTALGQFVDAVASYKTALRYGPDLAEAHTNLGNALKDLGRLIEAVAAYGAALRCKPDLAEAHTNLGNALRDLGRFIEAAATYNAALCITPDLAQAHANLGTVLQDIGQIDDAVASYGRALHIKPDLAETHSNLGAALQNLGRLEDAVVSYNTALQIKSDLAEAHSNLVFLRAGQDRVEPTDALALARQWEQACVPIAERDLALKRRKSLNRIAPTRLRVGYVSGDLQSHAISYFLEPILRYHDRLRVEVFVYPTTAKPDKVTERLETLADHWVPLIGLSDDQARQRIEADGIDVLIDLSGHTAGHRLGIFARRAAPVQAHYLGFFASTGLSEMDYWIGDEILTPAEMDGHFCETLWRLPRVWVSYRATHEAPLPAWHPADDGTIWLGSFNRLSKLTPDTIALWARVLQALPEGRLLLKTHELADSSNRNRVMAAFAEQGVAEARIELQDKRLTPSWTSHMASYDRLDLALDPVAGVGGGTTTCDALWMGVPVISLAGDRMATRMTMAMLHAIGRPEWIARDEADYVAKVVALARDPNVRRQMRAGQRQRMAASPLCDGAGLARTLEDAYTEMLTRTLAKEAPQPG